MNIIATLKEQINELHSQIQCIQEQCSHPKNCVTSKQFRSNSNWDQFAHYSVNKTCLLCEKQWTEKL
jgi:hypothetical protein